MYEHTHGSRIETKQVSADIGISAERWASIKRRAQERLDADPEVSVEEAYWDAVFAHVEVVPNIHVDGDVKGVEDIGTAADDATAEAQFPGYLARAPYGDGTATIDLGDRATYQRAWNAYQQALGAGADLAFDTFLVNNVDLDWGVAIDGDSVDRFRNHELGGGGVGND